jgi:hypothetical protein
MPNQCYQQDDEGGDDQNGTGTHVRTIAGKCSFGEPVAGAWSRTAPAVEHAQYTPDAFKQIVPLRRYGRFVTAAASRVAGTDLSLQLERSLTTTRGQIAKDGNESALLRSERKRVPQ